MKTPKLYHLVAYTSFIVSFTANSLLIYLARTRRLDRLGAYKHLITCFAFASIFYSTCDVIYQPVIIAKTGGHITFCSSPYGLGSSAEYVGALFAVNYGNTLLLIALHYVYRYFAVSKNHLLHYFNGKKLMTWLSVILVLDFLWFIGALFLFRKTPTTDEYLRSDFETLYEADVGNVSYLAVLFKTEVNGQSIYLSDSIIMTVVIVFQQTLTLMVIGACGYRTYKSIRKFPISTMTRNLQKKLFKMLLVQTGSPLVLMYFSIVVLIIAPFFGFTVGKNSIFISCALAVYPATEPLIILYFLSEFRQNTRHPMVHSLGSRVVSTSVSVHPVRVSSLS